MTSKSKKQKIQQNQKLKGNRNSINYGGIIKNNYQTLLSIGQQNKRNTQTSSKNITINIAPRTFYKRQLISSTTKVPINNISTTGNYRQTYGRNRYEQTQRKYSYAKAMKSKVNRSTNRIGASSSLHKQTLRNQQSSSFTNNIDSLDINHRRGKSFGATILHNNYNSKNNKNYILQQAKGFYKSHNYNKCINLLKPYCNNNQNCLQGRYLIAIQIWKQYYDCLIYRGKMYLKIQQYQLSIKDFQKAININQNKGFAYLGKATCQKQLNMIKQSINTLTNGLKQNNIKSQLLQKRGIIYYQIGQYSKSILDLQQCIQNNYLSTNGGIHWIRGNCYYKLNKPVQAILAYQQSLKKDTNSQNVTSSVQMLIKIKIQQKDFYQAYHILNRTNNIQINKIIIQQWRLLIQGILYLMKKKYKQGIQTLKKLLQLQFYKTQYKKINKKSYKQRYSFIKPLAHLYKGFGQLSQINMQNAKKDYQQFDKICQIIGQNNNNLSKLYNTLIIEAEQKFPQNCTKQLIQACKLIPNKPQPHLFIAFQKVNKLKLNQKYQQEQSLINQILQQIKIAIQNLPQLSNNHISSFYYYRSIIYFYINNFNQSIADIDRAIQKSQDNIPKYFYLRGLIFSKFGNFTQAIQDLSVCINLDQKFIKAYLQRSKCLQIQGSSNQAFIDLQKYITFCPSDPNIHKYAGFLLFQNCAYQDSISAFNHGNKLEKSDPDIILTMAKSHFLLNNIQQSIKYFKQYHQINNSNQYKNDMILIKITSKIFSKNIDLNQQIQIVNKILINNQNTIIFKKRDLYQILGTLYIYQGKYKNALKQLQLALKQFRKQKLQQLNKQNIQNLVQFQQQWSQVQIQYNIAIVYALQNQYQKSIQILQQFNPQNQPQYNQLIQFLKKVVSNQQIFHNVVLDGFQQKHRISKNWSKLQIKGISVGLAFSYPFVQPPQMEHQFDKQLFNQFDIKLVQKKPQAPWINRQNQGLIFTPNIQIFQDLQLSVTTKNNQSQIKKHQQIQDSIQINQSQFNFQTQALKHKFKLDSVVQMRLKRLMQKNKKKQI